MQTCTRLLPGLLLGLTLACGGSATYNVNTPPAPTTPKATGLAYTPAVATGWRLVEDAASTPTRLLLDLIGPAGTLSRGVGFNVQAPAGVKFGGFPASAGMPIADAGVYELLSSYPTYTYEPSLLGGGVKAGNLLTVGIFQKDRQLSAKDSGAPLCQIALEFDATANLSTGTSLPLTVPKARYIPGDIGPTTVNLATEAEFLEAQAKGHMLPMTIAVGTLTAK